MRVWLRVTLALGPAGRASAMPSVKAAAGLAPEASAGAGFGAAAAAEPRERAATRLTRGARSAPAAAPALDGRLALVSATASTLAAASGVPNWTGLEHVPKLNLVPVAAGGGCGGDCPRASLPGLAAAENLPKGAPPVSGEAGRGVLAASAGHVTRWAWDGRRDHARRVRGDETDSTQCPCKDRGAHASGAVSPRTRAITSGGAGVLGPDPDAWVCETARWIDPNTGGVDNEKDTRSVGNEKGCEAPLAGEVSAWAGCAVAGACRSPADTRNVLRVTLCGRHQNDTVIPAI